MSDAPRRTVEAGYDRVAASYLATKDPEDPRTLAALEDMVRDLSPTAPVLDLGCGAGIPATRWLAERGHAVTGVDLSGRQLGLARRLVPGATFVRADMADLDFEPATFAAVVALHSITHVPRDEQPALVSRLLRWLRPGGAFLATWGLEAWEGGEEDWEGWGAPMWWSNQDGEANLKMLRDAGFVVSSAEERGGPKDRWLWVLARKEGARDERAAPDRGSPLPSVP